jgi:uncharacterized membrane protein
MSVVAVYEEPMTEKEIKFIKSLLERDTIGYFKTMRMIVVVALSVSAVIALIATLTSPANKLEEQFSLSTFIITVVIALCLLLSMVVFGKKKFSWKYKQDLKYGKKMILLLPIQQKQFVPINQTYFFRVDEPMIKLVEVSQDDFLQYEKGDLFHIEIAMYSHTYLGYY